MRSNSKLTHAFVELVPNVLQEGVVYVSIPYATAIHRCFCGCGNEVVTPLSPTDWKLIFDGKTVSLEPSIGNWGFACRSHYWIKHDMVVWAGTWSNEQIHAGRLADSLAKERYFGGSRDHASPAEGVQKEQQGSPQSWLYRMLKKWFPK